MTKRRTGTRHRRGGTPALVLCLFLTMGSILGGAVGVAAVTTRAAERDYRRSQALALAEAGVAEALAGQTGHPARDLGGGTYAWSARSEGAAILVTATGEVRDSTGAPVKRTVRARLTSRGGRRAIGAWEEGR